MGHFISIIKQAVTNRTKTASWAILFYHRIQKPGIFSLI